MFYAFSTGTPMPYDKQALVGELREMTFLENYSYQKNADDMRTLLTVFHHFVSKIDSISPNWVPTPEDEGGLTRPFGTSVFLSSPVHNLWLVLEPNVSVC
jgi:hypothetical protein